MSFPGVWRREAEAISDAESTLKRVLANKELDATFNLTCVEDLIRAVGVLGVYHLLLMTSLTNLPENYSVWSNLSWSQEVFVPAVEYFDEENLLDILIKMGLANDPEVLINKLLEMVRELPETPKIGEKFMPDDDPFVTEDLAEELEPSQEPEWYKFTPGQY